MMQAKEIKGEVQYHRKMKAWMACCEVVGLKVKQGPLLFSPSESLAFSYFHLPARVMWVVSKEKWGEFSHSFYLIIFLIFSLFL